MNILPELGRIAAAKYGLQLKDPVYSAFDKLVQDDKFNLVKDNIEDDYAEFDAAMRQYNSDNTLSNVLRDFLELYSVLNGRAGFYSKVENPEGEDNICYWLNALIEELANCSNGRVSTSLPVIGAGIVNGTRFRAAIYHILDILQAPNAITSSTVSFKNVTPFYIFGRDVTSIVIYGNSEGVGELAIDPLAPTQIRIKIKIKITDMLSEDLNNDTIITYFPRGKLYEGDSVTVTIPSSYVLPYSIYKLEIVDFITEIEPTFKLTKELVYEAGDDDFIFLEDSTSETSTSIKYLNTKRKLAFPTTLGDYPATTIGKTTFMGKDVVLVNLPEGVTTIE